MAGRIAYLPRWLLAAFLLLAAIGSAHAEKRVALVIGNSAYRHARALQNPANDARLMSDTLKSLGFFVVGGGARLDLDRAGFDAALAEFDKELIGADVALLYYAGHGVETHGLNYLVPVDADPKDDGDVLAQGVGLAGILDHIEKASIRINLLLLDACRDNPFSGRGVRSQTGGLAQMQAPPGTLISFATQPRSVSLDGDDGHSPYTRALAETLKHPGYGLFRTFNEVGLAVEKSTHGEQLPWVSLSPISGNFYFAGKTPAAAPVQEARLTPADAPADIRRRDLVTDCDRLAATPWDTGHSPDLFGVMIEKIDVVAATRACDEAMAQYPDVMRFVFEAGRVATARKDFAAARRYYDKAAAAGYAMAISNIGAIYEDGSQGQPANHAEAVKWYTRAAEAGEPVAMMNLGWMYESGLGVKKNCAEAVRLYQTAANAGLSPAMSNLGLLYFNGKCVQRDYAEARRLFERALAGWSDNDAAMNDMGALYNEGAGVPHNRTLARQWFEKAAALGNHEAKLNLKDMGR
jgi:TPR repeat protein